MGLPLAFYYLTKGGMPQETVPDTVPDPAQRPVGPLVWLHTPRPEDAPIVDDLIARLSLRNPDLNVLVTSDDPNRTRLMQRCIHQPVPAEDRSKLARFIDFWAPDVLTWMGGELRPGLIMAAAASGIPLYMLDTGNAVAATRLQSRIPGLRRSVMRKFDRILAGDKATANAFRRAGAESTQVQVVGVLERDIPTLPCLEAERDTLAQLFAARPVWLAAEVSKGEFEAVLAAHSIALRRTHRLLLILVPSNPDDGPDLAKMLSDRDLTFEVRSTGGEPEAETQVYLADTDGEMGLWFRLAPNCFLGNSLVRGDGIGPHPFHAAALGSVVLHGPLTDQHRDAYLRLERTNASRQVADAEQLAIGVEQLLAPDKAADMAHAAWQVCSAGAEVTDLVVDLLSQAPSKPEASG